MANVNDVAAAVLEQLGEMSAMKLQKLVYYSQSWHLARENEPLFDDPIEAWRQGPVVKNLYDKHRGKYHVDSWPSGKAARLQSDERRTVEWVCDRYGGFAGVELSRMTHAELPWSMARESLPPEARSSNHLDLKIMANFYGRQIASPEAAVTNAVANAAVEGVTLDAQWHDRLRDVATGAISANALVAEELARLSR